MIVVFNTSVNFFDPFKSWDLGIYSTAVGSLTTSIWVYSIVGVDVIYFIFTLIIFRHLEK
jgi:hypothetical protein